MTCRSIRTRIPRRGAQAVGLIVGLGVLVWLIVRLVSDWDRVREDVAAANPALVLASVACTLGAETLFGLIWSMELRGVSGRTVPVARSTGVFFVSGLARLLPGGVFTYLGRMSLARDLQVGRAHLVASMVMETMTSAAAALTLGTAVLLSDEAGSQVPGGRWWLLALPFALAATYLPLSLRGLNLLLTRFGRSSVRIPRQSGFGFFGGYVVAWLAFGLGLWFLIRAFGLDGPNMLVAAGAFSLSWLLGFVVVIVPGGLGVREGAMTALLAPWLGVEQSILLALVSRFLWWLALGLLAAIGTWLLRRPNELVDSSRAPSP